MENRVPGSFEDLGLGAIVSKTVIGFFIELEPEC